MVYNQFMTDFAIRMGLWYNLASQIGVKEVNNEEDNTG
ncbi:hypothetical protein F4694_005687 [Bacillus niacini]|uniref:Uncharacterized protein n=1 Tax=Neobacillus niacini TaxID=86668 RepID=A0A852TKY7_9BACI|nr:hypothetical protein [Neobacillus niacini]